MLFLFTGQCKDRRGKKEEGSIGVVHRLSRLEPGL